MSGSPDPVTAGGQVTYALTTTNLGPDTSSSLSVSDTLPPNVTYVSASGSGWSCSAAAGVVTCTRSTALASGANTVLSIVTQVNSSINGTITNSATVSAATPDGIPNNNTATASVAVISGADLSITKSVSPSPVIASGATTFTLSPRNASGPDAASTVSVTDTLPAGFTGIAASGTNWSCSVNQGTRTVTCTRATLPVGATDNISVTATAPDDTFVPAGGMSSSNTATISASTADPNAGNNSGTVNFTLQRDGADMSITKTRSPNPVAQGATITSVLTARNNGPRALTAGSTITITDTLPAGEDYTGPASFTNNGWSCAFAAGVFTCTRNGPLAINTNAPALTLTTTATGAASLTNQGCVALGGAITDPNSANDCVSASVASTAARADLRIVKAGDLNPVTTADGTLTYTLTISNQGPDDSASVVVSDVIPMRTALAGGTLINASAGTGNKGSTGSCSVATATVTCNYASLLFHSGAPADTAETAVITITVQRPMADGAFTNTASINSTTVGDPDRSNNSSSVNTTVQPIADVTVQSKTVTPNPVRAGVDATYVITFKNNGPSTAANVTLADQFSPAGGDSGYTVQSSSASQGSCSFNAGADLLSCAIGSMAANATQTVTVVARPKWMAAPPGGRNLPNTATIATTTVDSNAANDSKSATLNINTALVDLIANITDVSSFAGVAPDPLGFDGINTSTNIITYKVTVTNSGPSQATGVTFQNTYSPPNGRSVTFLCDSDDPLSCHGAAVCSVSGAATVTGPATQVVNCTSPSLEAAANSVRYLRYQINTAPAATGDTYSNSVTVGSNETESNSGNNTATEPTAVRAKADVQVSSKTAVISSPPLQYGQTFQWQIAVANNGPGNAYQTTLSDTLPTNMEIISPLTYSVSPGPGTCTNSGLTQFSCDLGTMAPSTAQTVTVDVVIRKPPSAPYPTSYTNTASVSTFSVDLVSGNNSNTGTVSLVKSSIAGRVYRDNNNNGVIDGGENGVNGVLLTLTGHDVFNNAVSRTGTTDASGNYLIDSLEQADASGYTLTETQPANYADGLETAGTAATGAAPGGTVSATIGSNTITAIRLDKDQVATGYNFGELRRNSLAGTVFADVNNDGTKQGTEPGIQSVTLTLTGTDARGTAVNTTTTTGAAGTYTFNNVLPGSYTITETQPTTYGDGIDTAGSLGGSAAVNDTVSGISVADVNGTGYNFGELPASLSGKVWRDANRNGALDGGEAGINAVTITLSGTSTLGAAVARTTTTNASGDYVFADLPSGTYTVTETQPTGFGSSTPNSLSGITVAAAGSSSGHDFGDTTSQLSGNVFLDRNANGLSDGTDTPIAGVSFTLTGTDAQGAAVSLTASSDASGNVVFDDLVAPDASGYTLTETQPAAYSNGQVTAGTAGGAASQAQNRVTGIALAAGTTAGSYLFAELGTPITGTVYRDSNRNGTQDIGEPGIAGVTVNLLDAGNVQIGTTTTAADGSYSFPPQAGGSFTVVEVQPAAYQSGPEHASNSVAVALVAGTPQVVNFGESAGSFAGTVFLDGNDDGVQQGGEIGLPGITVTLTGTDSDGAAVNRTAVTNPAGHYQFDDVLAGTYAINETQPAVFGDGKDVLGAGNAGGTVGNDVYSAISLPVGTQATGYNFGEKGSAITGVVFADANRNGTQEPGDTGIAGVTVTLKDASNATVATTTTAADGSYLFAGVPAGNYNVVETQPAGYGSSASSPDSVAVTVPAGGSATARFADTHSTLVGSVYIDLNNNGVRDGGEPGISGITVTLTGTDAAGNAVNRSAATDASGAFSFIDLLTPNGAGYSLHEPAQPAGYSDGQDAAGTAGGTAGNEVINGIALGVNTDATGYTFGERGTSLSGVVYKDLNANGTRDPQDTTGLAGITITLKDGLGNIVATTVTAADGSYSFNGLAAGNYTVEETQPAGYGSSTPNSSSVTVTAGNPATVDFGETTSSLAGFVWSDTNGDAVKNPGEPGIAGVTVRLTGTDAKGAAVSRTATTDAAGNYSFTDLLSGTYVITETQPAAYADGGEVAGTAGGSVANDVISAIALPVGTASTGYGFAEKPQAISGHVWLDSNRDANRAATEQGIVGVVLTLKDANGVTVATTTTAADGSYHFDNVPAGRYTLVESQPAGYGSSTPDSVALDLTNASGTPPVVDFGETAGSLAGQVYDDANNNGHRDAGEPGIANVTLTLSGTDARGNAVTRSVTTGKDGHYRVADLPGGSYTLTETQPAGYDDGMDTLGGAGGTAGNDVFSAVALAAAQDATGYDFGERGTDASLSGRVWRDLDHDRRRSTGEALQSGWIVELFSSGELVKTATTDLNGVYQFSGLPPGSGYEVRFREPSSHAVFGIPVTNEQGLASQPDQVGAANPGGADVSGGTIAGLTLPPGATITEQSLPLDPSGVVYDSVSRRPVAGASVTLTGPGGFDADTQLLGGASNATQLTDAQGLYQFLLLPGAPAGTYTITVTPPAGRYMPGPSILIPACEATLAVGAVPAPAIVQAASEAPAASVPNLDPARCPASSAQLGATAGTTQYFLRLTLAPGVSANLIDNHIPVDPILSGAITVTKTTPLVNVSRGDLVPYTITVANTLDAALSDIDVRDLLPPGFAYRAGSASIDGVPSEPQRAGRQLTWIDQAFAPRQRKVLKLVLVVGAGVGDAEYVNQAFALNNQVNTVVSNVASATVRVVPDPVFDCSDIIGKVFDDRNANGYQDEGEGGIANVRLATLNGVLVTTDADGRFHVACAAIPNEYRGSNFVMKVDPRTLPAGFRLTTENPRDVRVTRGKMVKINFGATIHRVVRVTVR
ncbi:MAG: SdrD B-like domain-containing protein, partial [Steroidobacteraceae bacterium]